MNKPPVSKTLQYLFLIILLSTLATAAIINSSQYRSTSTAITPASATINNTNFSTTSAFEFVGGTANSSQYSTILGTKPTLPACGNNILELGESCDGTSLNNQTCISQRYTSGTLTCKPDCSGFDTNACILFRPKGPSGPTADIIEGGEIKKEETTTTTSTTTTTTSLAQPQKELPAKIPDKITQALKKAAKQLSALETETGKFYNAILLIVITLAGYLFYLILKYFKKRIWPRIQQQRAAQQQQQQTQQQQQRELRDYLKQNLEQGHQPSFIISTLLQHGWQKEEIQQALEQVLEEIRK